MTQTIHKCAVCGRPSEEAALFTGPTGRVCRECVEQAHRAIQTPALASTLRGSGGATRRAGTNVPKPVAVIPARYGSTRFPGKPLALIAGKPMVQQVVERCRESQAFSRVIVATEDERIVLAVKGFGGEVAMTSPSCPSGTDRVAEVAEQLPGEEVFVNVQGDEPVVSPDALKTLAAAFADPAVQMATLIRPLDEEERSNPNVVKVVLGRDRRALYFSRSDIPYAREPISGQVERWGHLGLYGYRREVLERLAGLPPPPLESSEKLEQLRALEHGISIHCFRTDYRSVAVDTPDDLQAAERLLKG